MHLDIVKHIVLRNYVVDVTVKLQQSTFSSLFRYVTQSDFINMSFVFVSPVQ